MKPQAIHIDRFCWNRRLEELIASSSEGKPSFPITQQVIAHITCLNSGAISRFLDPDPNVRIPMPQEVYDSVAKWFEAGRPTGQYWLLPERRNGDTMWYGERGELYAFRRIMDKWVNNKRPLTYDEAAAILGVAQTTVRDWYIGGYGHLRVPKIATEKLNEARKNRTFKLPYAVSKKTRWEVSRYLAFRRLY